MEGASPADRTADPPTGRLDGGMDEAAPSQAPDAQLDQGQGSEAAQRSASEQPPAAGGQRPAAGRPPELEVGSEMDAWDGGSAHPQPPEAPSTSEPGASFGLNSQTLAGIAFFLALDAYRDKDMAMAVALSLESALYWSFFARRKRRRRRADAAQLPPQLQRADSSTMSEPPRSQRKKRPLASPRLQQPARRPPLKSPTKTPLKQPGRTPKRQRYVSRVVEGDPSSPSLHAGMVVLLRRERHLLGGRERTWGLGRILRIISARRTIDVVWLRPDARGLAGRPASLAELLALRWLPVSQPPEGASAEARADWQARSLQMSAVRATAWPEEGGSFRREDLPVVAAAVEALEGTAPESQHPAP